MPIDSKRSWPPGMLNASLRAVKEKRASGKPSAKSLASGIRSPARLAICRAHSYSGLKFMRRPFQLVVGATLAASFLFPLIEYFERWDSTPGPGSDTELYVLCLIVGIGIVFALRRALRFLPELLVGPSIFMSLASFCKPAASFTPLCKSVSASPPLPLRI